MAVTAERDDDPRVPPDRAERYRRAGWWRAQLIDELVLGAAGAEIVDGDEVVGHAELVRRVESCATGLHERGIGPGDAVVVQLPNGLVLPVVVLALIRIGARPVLTLPALREHELDAVISSVRPVALAVPARSRRFDHVAMARGLAERHACVRLLLVSGADPGGTDVDLDALCVPGASAAAAPRVQRHPTDVALYLLSSGTTGPPKPIPRTHEAFGHVIREATAVSRLDADSVYLAVLPATHSFVFGHPGILGTLSVGGRVTFGQPDDPVAALTQVARDRVTHCALTPAVLLGWLRSAEREPVDTASLRVLQVGGSRLDEATGRRATDLLGAGVQQVFGMSEGLLNFTRVDDPPEVVLGTQGRPSSPGDEVRVVDDGGADVTGDGSGELWTRGPSVIAGYHRGASPASFTPDGWYRTGDLVRRDASGNLVVAGRIKDVINRGGEKIAADELEGLLAEHPGVHAAAAVAMPHPAMGEAVCVFVVPDGEPPTLRELRAFLEGRGLARFKLPERMETTEALPVAGVGKVDKVALRARAAELSGGGPGADKDTATAR